MSQERNGGWSTALLALILAATVVALNVWLVPRDSVESAALVRYELSSNTPGQDPKGWIHAWFWTQEAPFKYRILGKLAVGGIYALETGAGVPGDQAMYCSILICCFVFLTLTFWAVARLTAALGMGLPTPLDASAPLNLEKCAMALTALCPPILFFGKFPVHGGPNDLLGYALMAAGLRQACLGRARGACILLTIAVFCRETTLLDALAILFLPFSPRQRLVMSVLPLLALMAFRGFWPGLYDPTKDAQQNFELPIEAAIFLLLTFGPVWILGCLGWLELKRMRLDRLPVQAFCRSFVPALVLTAAVILFFARVREIRISFVLFIYLIPFSSLWISRNAGRLSALARSPRWWVWNAFALAISVRFRIYLMPLDKPDFVHLAQTFGAIFLGFENLPQCNWTVVTPACMFLMLACLPFATAEARSRPASPNLRPASQ